MEYETTLENLEKLSEEQYIKEYDEPVYEARELYDKRKSLKKTNFALRRLTKEMGGYREPVKTIVGYKIIYLTTQNNAQIELIRFTQSMDGTSDKKEPVFTGVKAVWYDRPFRELIYRYYHGDINDFYVKIESMNKDEIETQDGLVPKNLALQFIQNLRLIVSGGSVERANRGVFKIHHDLQIAPTHVVKIMEALDITCRPVCVMKKSESEYERGMAPKWLIDLAYDKHELNSWGDQLTEEEKRIFAKVKKTEMIIMEGGCTCGHTKRDHYKSERYVTKNCEICDCSTFKLREDTKRTIEV